MASDDGTSSPLLDLPSVAEELAAGVRVQISSAFAVADAALGGLDEWKAQRQRELEEQLRALEAEPVGKLADESLEEEAPLTPVRHGFSLAWGACFLVQV